MYDKEILSIYLNEKPDENVEEQVVVEDDVSTKPRVLLFNDEIHTFDEVVEQIMKAINCSFDHAEALTWEVHTKGKATVYDGEMDECIRVSSVLEEIDLHTQILM